MKYNGKYSLKTQLLEVGQKKGVATANNAGTKYELKIVGELKKLFTAIPELKKSSAKNSGTTGADVEITLNRSKVKGKKAISGLIVPIECKTNIQAKFGNASLAYEKGVGYKWGPRKMSKMQKGIKTELTAAIALANDDKSAQAICDKISGGPKKLSSTGCGVSMAAPKGTINKWYAAKTKQGADYIQIKHKGLYLMPGSKDSFGFNEMLKKNGIKSGLPYFTPKSERITIRHKQMSGLWKPLGELTCSGLPNSPIDLDNIEAVIKLYK